MSQEHAERDLALEIINGKNTVIKQLPNTLIWALASGQPTLQNDPCDPCDKVDND